MAVAWTWVKEGDYRCSLVDLKVAFRIKAFKNIRDTLLHSRMKHVLIESSVALVAKQENNFRLKNLELTDKKALLQRVFYFSARRLTAASRMAGEDIGGVNGALTVLAWLHPTISDFGGSRRPNCVLETTKNFLEVTARWTNLPFLVEPVDSCKPNLCPCISCTDNKKSRVWIYCVNLSLNDLIIILASSSLPDILIEIS